MTVVAFCEQLGIPRPTWYRWRAAGSSTKGPWPTPAQDAVEADAKALAATWDAWGHRKLASLKRVGIDDIEPAPVSDSTMYRALKRNGLCLPVGYTGEVRQLAGARRETFIEPPTRRNRLWQADFSEFETLGQGTWNLGAVVDYWAKVDLACTVSATKTTRDAIAFFEAALAEVEVLLGVGLSAVLCKRRSVHSMMSRPGKWMANALSACFQPQVPVPSSPPLSLLMRCTAR
jgi:hypothetical protein